MCDEINPHALNLEITNMLSIQLANYDNVLEIVLIHYMDYRVLNYRSVIGPLFVTTDDVRFFMSY